MVDRKTLVLKTMKPDEVWVLSKKYDEPKKGESKFKGFNGETQYWRLYGMDLFATEESNDSEEVGFFVNETDWSEYDFEKSIYTPLYKKLADVDVGEKFKLTHRLVKAKKGGWKSIWVVESIDSTIEKLVDEIIKQEKDGKKYTKAEIEAVFKDNGTSDEEIEKIWAVYDAKRQ